ncbi:uncharacterized protein EI97DRAFT_311330 [Westerdykella ornata]|uniref:Uncharacterized protein n=1 Tax=Westerdykella ornata TaxID=318751 RepID=A0A6A6JKZ4_WESOR|nr:uncharacterized protein EI97DRAFT_311330 [Westerdykella ornata]KAF2277152.1 hypothetical protein EI97DRAFT_311330 [Westerdykella ornata]
MMSWKEEFGGASRSRGKCARHNVGGAEQKRAGRQRRGKAWRGEEWRHSLGGGRGAGEGDPVLKKGRPASLLVDVLSIEQTMWDASVEEERGWPKVFRRIEENALPCPVPVPPARSHRHTRHTPSETSSPSGRKADLRSEQGERKALAILVLHSASPASHVPTPNRDGSSPPFSAAGQMRRGLVSSTGPLQPGPFFLLPCHLTTVNSPSLLPRRREKAIESVHGPL